MINKGDWRNKFFDNYFEIEDVDEEKWISYKNKHLNRIFQYSRVKHAKTLILDDLMYLREIKDLNDPFEGDLLYDLDEFYNNPLKDPSLSKEDIKNIFHEANKSMKERVYIACFADKNNITPMWNHYANGHEGICVEYDLNEDKLLKQIFFPIAYVDEERNKEILRKLYDNPDYYGKLTVETFCNKSIEWEYEQEWRIIIPKESKGMFNIILHDGKHFIEFLKPKSVYLGYKINEKGANFVKQLCDKRKIPVYKMIKDNSNFNLAYVPYE
jgi:hypothetical protein